MCARGWRPSGPRRQLLLLFSNLLLAWAGSIEEAARDGWTNFRQEPIADGSLIAFTREGTRNGVQEVAVNASGLAVSVDSLVDTFLSESLSHEWNDYIGTVEHLGGNVQLQTYQLPWPFTPREYLMHCLDEPFGGSGHRTRCVPVAGGHKKAPERRDRVRGSSETLWQMSPASSDPRRRADLYFRGQVDPGGALPKWLVNEIGKHGSVNVVASLIKLAASRQL